MMKKIIGAIAMLPLLFFPLVASAANAPDDIVSGTVKDTHGEAIIGCTVMIKGTTTGVVTDIDGQFSFSVAGAPMPSVLEFSCLGYTSQEFPLLEGGRRVFDLVLSEESMLLEETVVTALGIKRSEKALNYNVQQVSKEALTTVKDANFVNALSGKVAGLNINASSGGVGGASKVVMRGTKGIEQSSNALYVIDGVPMYSMVDAQSTGAYGSDGTTEAIADLNPEDIESISVLTGAAAAALYGSHASNGAIVVTTKKGEEGKASITITSNTEVLRATFLPKFQSTYGNRAGESTSWGAKINPNQAWNGSGYSPAKDFLKTGVVTTETVSLSVGNKHNQTYLSASAVNSNGIVPNNAYNRYNFSLRNTSKFLKDKMTLDLGASFIIQNDRNMVNQGQYRNPILPAYLFPRGEDWSYSAQTFETYDPTRGINVQNWEWLGKANVEWNNPYWTAYRMVRKNDRQRYAFNAGLTYDILDWLKVAGHVKVDNSTTEYTLKDYASSSTTTTEGSSNGYYHIHNNRDSQVYADALLSINKEFDHQWTLAVNVGGSISDMRYSQFLNRGGIRADGLPNLFNIMQLDPTKIHREQTIWREQTQSVFGSVEVGWKKAIFLTVTGRNDWASQLAGAHSRQKSFFYPSVGLAVCISELVGKMPEQLEYVKVRGSFASVGMPFPRFIANPTYAWNEANQSWETSKNYPMYNLKPERTNSWEVGLTMRFLRNFSLDVSYYDTKTFNQTFNSQLSVSSGYKNLYVQTGSVRNRGVELALGFKKKWHEFGWNSNYTFSYNKNEILELMENYKHPETGQIITLDQLNVGGLGDVNFLLRKGGSLGDIYTTSDLARDESNHIKIGEDGSIAKDTNIGFKKLGSVLPTSNMAWNNEFSFFGVNIGFLLSARLGGVCYSATQARLDAYGVSEVSALARDNGGVPTSSGVMIDPEKYFSTVGADYGIPQYYTYSATNLRLQEAHIGYTFPAKLMHNVCELTLSVVGRNLWMIYCKAPFDPEAVASTGNYYQGIDNFMTPTTRSVGFNIRLKF